MYPEGCGRQPGVDAEPVPERAFDAAIAEAGERERDWRIGHGSGMSMKGTGSVLALRTTTVPLPKSIPPYHWSA